ncbi:radial spoke head 14 homolog [Lethenteron reissneri]|uniref:radial spoke head 14 homolog n=1 Tax=Lethenteron reissneri TaxID=7753 RepID=UPI002AB6C041|nr:radial spoke head 14 homolog [Lethenteron reissneri]XP_061417256.1 radial spoke head 14 homolog [Lethenteron reissneri]
MALYTRSSVQMPPDVDPTKATLAFGDRALPRLCRELQGPELLTRQRALMALCDLVHEPEMAYEAVRVGCLECLRSLLVDEDATVRCKTTEALSIMVSHSITRTMFLSMDLILPLSHLFDDDVDICRLNTHKTLEMLSEIPHGALGIVEAGLVPCLVKKLRSELNEICELILDTLDFCLAVDTKQALEVGAVDVLLTLLLHESERIRAKAARATMNITVSLEGKNQACDKQLVPILVGLLSDSSTDVRGNAAGAIMSIAVTTQGKYAALGAEAVHPLVELVTDGRSEVRLNAIKAITALAEAPEGREALLPSVSLLGGCRSDASAAVANAVDIALRVITWRP